MQKHLEQASEFIGGYELIFTCFYKYIYLDEIRSQFVYFVFVPESDRIVRIFIGRFNIFKQFIKLSLVLDSFYGVLRRFKISSSKYIISKKISQLIAVVPVN